MESPFQWGIIIHECKGITAYRLHRPAEGRPETPDDYRRHAAQAGERQGAVPNLQKIGMQRFLLHTMEWRMDGPDFSVKFPNFSKCLQKTVTLRQYTKDNIRKGDERPEHKIKTEMQFLIHMILLLKLTGWLEYQPGRRDRQMRTHAEGMGFFYFMHLWLIFAEVCPTGPVRFILKKEYAASAAI